MIVRESDNITQWFKFFLIGIIETAKNGISTFDNILQLQKRVDLKLQSLRSRSANAQKVVAYLYQRPLIDAEKISQVTSLSLPSSYSLIEALEKINILKEVTGGQRGRMYIFEEYLNIFR